MQIQKLKAYFKLLRPNQWIKNFIVFAALIFNGALFNHRLLYLNLLAFLVFCLLSSASYTINDLIDLPFDRKHPQKKFRPLASSMISVLSAQIIALVLTIAGLAGAYFLNMAFFVIALSFLIVHVLYSLFLKKKALLDILLISSSFVLRALAGEAITGLHLPVWLLLTVVFLSLFVASCKRHSELLAQGVKTRPSLEQYQEHLLNFYTSTFATATLVTYALFAFLEEPVYFRKPLQSFLKTSLPLALGRKWMMLTIPFVIIGLMRYAQLIYLRHAGEQPEKIITSDKPLVFSIMAWGIIVIALIYLV